MLAPPSTACVSTILLTGSLCIQAEALRTLLATKLTGAAPSAAGTTIATWLLVEHLAALNLMTLRAHVDPTREGPSLRRGVAAVQEFIAGAVAHLQQGSVTELLRRRGWVHLLAHAARVYHDTCGHFELAIRGASWLPLFSLSCHSHVDMQLLLNWC